ncbi:beta-glucosidase [Salmonella enterica subsp. enterica]|uniref:Beta-glucosidase n=1 Tax=Salmonella enterica I TaxID=59201 RepID=A0A3S4I2Q4_SALET|nr:beta-glucosidase [Salmonella enterica subsp. enterica]
MSSQRLFNDYMPPYKAGLDAGSGRGDGGAETR